MGPFKRRARRDRRLDKILQGHEPPVFPQGTARLLRMLRDPEGDNERISEALSWDAGLVVRILKTVNSAAFGTARKIDDVRHAVAFMGRSQLEHLVLAVAVRQSLPSSPAPGFEAGRFWQAAFFRAALSRAIAERLHPAEAASSFTGGLLQDMAVPVLAHARPQDYGPVLSTWHGEESSSLHELERSAFGWDHADVGGLLAQDWDLPDALVGAIRHHHGHSSDWELLPSTRLVAVLRETRAERGLGAFMEEARASYGLDSDWLRDTVAACDQGAAELVRALM